MAKPLRVGDALELEIEFSVRGVLTDPTTVKLEVKDPSGNIDTYLYSLAQITRKSIGIYAKTILFDEYKWWTYEWEATGTVQCTEGNRLYVGAALI